MWRGLNPPRTQLACPPTGNLASKKMFPKFFWFLPTTGDSRSIVGGSHASTNRSNPKGFRPPTRRYLAEVARAADRLGFEGVLTPTGTWCCHCWARGDCNPHDFSSAAAYRVVGTRAW